MFIHAYFPEDAPFDVAPKEEDEEAWVFFLHCEVCCTENMVINCHYIYINTCRERYHGWGG